MSLLRPSADGVTRRRFPLEIKAVDEATGHFVAYGATFGNVDLGGDRIKRGAFKRTLLERKASGRPLKMLYRHSDVIGVFDKVQEDRKGLLVEGRPLVDEVARATETSALMKAGALDEFSIGYHVRQHEMNRDGTRELIDLDLLEVSIVPFAMNPQALLVSVVKSNDLRTQEDLVEALTQGEAMDPDLAAKVAEAAWPKLHPETDLCSLLGPIAKLTEQHRSAIQGGTQG